MGVQRLTGTFVPAGSGAVMAILPIRPERNFRLAHTVSGIFLLAQAWRLKHSMPRAKVVEPA